MTFIVFFSVLLVATSGEKKELFEVNINDHMYDSFFAGEPVKAFVNKHGYFLKDVKTGEIILYVNYTAMEEKLTGVPIVTKDQAIKLAKQVCGGMYTLARVTENPYDYDILFERYVDGIPVFGETCYVSINKMTGKINAYRKMPTKKIDFRPVIRISKDDIMKMTGAINAKLVIIPETRSAVWIVTYPTNTIIDASTGRKWTKEEIYNLAKLYKTTINFKELGAKVIKNLTINTESIKTIKIMDIDNNQGAVFREDDPMTRDDIVAAKNSMETPRPNNQPAWDPSVDDYDIVGDKNTVNNILGQYEAVFYSGHGTKPDGRCIIINDPSGYDKLFCKWDIANNRQTRLFVLSACYVGKEFADSVVEKGVQCAIGASGEIRDFYIFSPCADWAKLFWDRVTGNKEVGYQLTAHSARIEANACTWISWCDLDTEKGYCNIYIFN